MMRTCTAWFAAIEAAPQLWPSARLHGPEAVAELGSWDWNEDSVPWAGVEQVLMDAAAKSQAAVERAAALDPLTWRVEISGCGDQVRAEGTAYSVRLHLKWLHQDCSAQLRCAALLTKCT